MILIQAAKSSKNEKIEIYHIFYSRLKLINISENKMNQNPQKRQEIPREKVSRRLKKKNIRQVFKQGDFSHQIMLATFKKYYTWKQKRPIKIPLQTLNSDVRQPAFSIALHCGTKNGTNEIINDYIKPPVIGQNDMKNQTMNKFQKILTDPSSSKSNKDVRRLTFVDFKTKKRQKDNFFSYPDVQKIHLTEQEETRRVKTQPKTCTTSYRKTGFTKQLANLKEMIKKLPSVQEPSQRFKVPKPKEIKLNLWNNSFISNNSYINNQSLINQTFIKLPSDQLQQEPNERKKIFRKSKTQNLKGYMQQLKEVISYADQLINEQDVNKDEQNQDDIFNITQNAKFTRKSLSPQHGLNKRKYWPEYPKYSISHQAKKQEQGIGTFFSNFSYSDPKINDELQTLVNAMKKDLNQQQKQMNKEIAESQKNAIDLRYKYKMSIQKDNYKRNVKSFLKCKKQYRIEKRREQVRANGIIRIKKSNNLEKVRKVVQKQDETS